MPDSEVLRHIVHNCQLMTSASTKGTTLHPTERVFTLSDLERWSDNPNGLGPVGTALRERILAVQEGREKYKGRGSCASDARTLDGAMAMVMTLDESLND
ncbi:hypothetical protein JVT61DRAFT_6821 [Boletus reticuloceps]|uniref:Uncharacterized protein n=1 Tax=Boletus reticuloceps TaxID=495285 RepID=A0A8I2YJS9_9AGAM|nr:hypothetical protein JVT61DRAFT_6821 [Boletus reticuloceps]